MIDGLKPYAEMKDSGVQWLGDVPAHWNIVPAFVAYSPRDVRNTGMAEKTVLSLSYGRIVIKPEEKLRGLVPESFETYQIVEPGNIIVRTTDLQNDRNSLRIGHAKDRGIITSAYLCLETNSQVENEFGYQYLNAYDLLKIIYGYGSGLRQNLDFKDIKRMPVLLPPKDEQVVIVRFLDHADRRIRRAVAAKQKLIRLLEEQKRAIIHRAVTRGLDPDVRLKPSGVEWLGEVPEHWTVLPLRRVSVSRCDGPFGSGLKSAHYVDDGVRVVRLQNIGHAEFKGSSATYISAMHYASLGDHSVLSGDILIAGLGDDRHPAGRACVAPSGIEPAMVKADCFRFRVDENRLLPDFAALQLTATAVGASAALSTGATRQRTNLQSTAGRAIALPPIEEQKRIIERVTDAVAPILKTRAILNGEMTLLREYWIRLVADVVTGKLDVREAAATLPELADPADSEIDIDEENEVESMEEGAAEDQAA
ncbi:restriction endonuclease subunit S [Arenimonas malthae]|nr:restriction endonuclease subunit S [Arenimonas malthae]